MKQLGPETVPSRSHSYWALFLDLGFRGFRNGLCVMAQPLVEEVCGGHGHPNLYHCHVCGRRGRWRGTTAKD